MTCPPSEVLWRAPARNVWPFARATRLLLIAAGLVAALAGCGLDATLHRMDLATYQRQCSEFGFTPGTDAFAQCMQRQAAQREEENQRTLDRIHRDEAADKLKKK